MNNLITYLLHYAKNHGISYAIVDSDLTNPSMSFHETNRMLTNVSWYNPVELTFIIDLEIRHLINGDSGDNGYTYSSSKGSQECTADKFSLKLLFDYLIKNADYFDEP